MLIKKINSNSKIGLITPAGKIGSFESLNEFVKTLESYGLTVVLGESINSKYGYLSGTDEIRAKDIMDMFEDDSIDAILCYKGGYGCQRLLPYLDFEKIKKHPKLFMGYSDITVMLNVLYQKCNMPSVHGMMGVSLGNKENYSLNHMMTTIFEGFKQPLSNPSEELIVVNEGVCEGTLVGGNLSLIYALMGTEYEIDLKDKILFVEEVNESPYAIDRMLSSLSLSNKLKGLKGIICGYFTNCESDTEITYQSLLVHYFKQLNIPFVMNFQSGHQKPFVNLPIGLKVKLDTYQKHIVVEEEIYRK